MNGRMLERVAIIGAGSWGTTLAWLLGARGVPVRLWARDARLAAELAARRVNTRYLPEVELPVDVEPTSDLAHALAGSAVALVVVPSVGVARIAQQMAPVIAPGTVVGSAAKGLDHETGRRMSVVLADALGPACPVAALSGPNLAHEVVARLPAAAVAAHPDDAVTGPLQALLSSATFRVYTNPDLAGVELCGALKNPLAIAAGICDGLCLGDNAKAVLMTRGMHEIQRLGVALGADARTFAGLCGFGDLLATCHSPQSRNRTLGEQIGRGRHLSELLAETSQVAEGVPTTRTAVRLAREHGVDMPILEELHAVLFADKPVQQAVEALMLRSIGGEFA